MDKHLALLTGFLVLFGYKVNPVDAFLKNPQSLNISMDYNASQLTLSEESRISFHLMERYKKVGNIARPVENAMKTVKVEFGLALIQILDFDETNQVLTTNVWKRYIWLDEILRWNPSEFGNISNIRLPAPKIWTPDIVLYNNADTQEKQHLESVTVAHFGLVRWIPPAIYKSSCQIEMRNFPFDTQTCFFKFGSWVYDGHKLDLVFYEGRDDVDLREYVESSEWNVVYTSAKRNVRTYPCCDDEPYPDLTFRLTVKRKTAFYMYVLILPSVMLSFLTLVLFWIPPQRPDRTSLGMSLFSSFFVLLLILVQSSPPTASISLLGVYYCLNMVLIAISTMVSALVINLTYYLQRRKLPFLIKAIFVQHLGRLLCVSRNSLADEPNEINKRTSSFTEQSFPLRNGKASEQTLSKRNDWKILASVIDRLFFIIYTIGLVLSLIFVFPR
ncbi:DgyrCDS12454 [Dimorphilus gyrociliatus]|uniref:DgyrCDS12454 n=2 Tax=Dimorphilus gyrociliatus TaxID=2664684 RepID=A0A7I8W6H2_9ANNE|nr:DgyrCDS12454 [Dimorphilus gyrociliatus]